MKTTPTGTRESELKTPITPSQNAGSEHSGTRPVRLRDGVVIGGEKVAVIAGPCAIETLDQTLDVSQVVKDAGATLLRGGIYKLRTSPNSFQGLQEKGFDIAREVCDKTGLGLVTEVVDEESLALACDHAQMIQVGTRNMHNYPLLKAIGKRRIPVLLKRGFAATLNEFLLAAQYILDGGNEDVVLCERGIRTFCEYSRFTLDLNIVPAIKARSPMPVVVDVSHGTGRRDLVPSMALAAIACGADGVMIEVHNAPDEALSDGQQSLSTNSFGDVMMRLRAVAEAVGRSA